ncbi:MAG: hypothetical protein IT479_05895 [Xanthomonadales bacterium]|nr:hypothetical protein [Xanthomonadales bacterium]
MSRATVLFLSGLLFPALAIAQGARPHVGAGSDHMLALRDDGAVFAWGGNFFGQLGVADNNDRDVATMVPMLGPGSGVIQVVAGPFFSLALKRNGEVLSWGASNDGRLGFPGASSRNQPGPVLGLAAGSGVIAIAAGGLGSAFALKSDGSVWAWGDNSNFQLGDNTQTDRNAPQQVLGGLPAVRALGAGDAHTLAVLTTGAVWGWGFQSGGQLCNKTGAVADPPTPAFVQLPAPVSGVGGTPAGVREASASQGRSMFLLDSGVVQVCGGSAVQARCEVTSLGGGLTYIGLSNVPNLPPVRTLAVGSDANYFVTLAGATLACGANDFGQLGSGTATPLPGILTPTAIAGLPAMAQAAIGSQRSQGGGVANDGRVYTWGSGQRVPMLGTGPSPTLPAPARQVLLQGGGTLSLGAGDRLFQDGFES